jgi:uncharacterized membrane protein
MFGLKIRKILPYLICFVFFLAYAALSVVRHLHYGSFGFDLGLTDQVVWEYSQFHAPITTIDHIPFISNLFVHVELIYILFAPFYWIYNNVITFILLQAFFATASGIPVFLLAKKHGLNKFICYALLVSYLMFYGVQNALWFDVHSTVFGTSFLSWFIYFLDAGYLWPSLTAFLLTIISKENYAAMTLLVSFVYLVYRREKRQFLFIGLSILYLCLIFGIYYPHFAGGYRFQSQQGLFGGLNLLDFINTKDKLQVIGYTFAWTGLLSLLQPVFLIPLIGNLASYFILGREVSTAQGLFLQYRIELAPLLFLATVYGIERIKKLNSAWTGLYLLLCLMIFQYQLHLPLSYLTKGYFWHEPASVKNINTIIFDIPADASVVAQDNIIPHVSHRLNIFTLWPDKKTFLSDSPCGKVVCDWFRWTDRPQYLIVDTGPDWDIRHLLANREDYINGLNNLEKAKIISKFKQKGNAVLYKIQKQP